MNGCAVNVFEVHNGQNTFESEHYYVLFTSKGRDIIVLGSVQDIAVSHIWPFQTLYMKPYITTTFGMNGCILES